MLHRKPCRTPHARGRRNRLSIDRRGRGPTRHRAKRATTIARRAPGANSATAPRRAAARRPPAGQQQGPSVTKPGRKSAPRGPRSLPVPGTTARRGPPGRPTRERHPVRIPAATAAKPDPTPTARRTRPAAGALHRARSRRERGRAPMSGAATTVDSATSRTRHGPTRHHANRATTIVRHAPAANSVTALHRAAVRRPPAGRQHGPNAMTPGPTSAPRGPRSLPVPQTTARRGLRPARERHRVRLPAAIVANPGTRTAPRMSRAVRGPHRARSGTAPAGTPTPSVATTAVLATSRAGHAPMSRMPRRARAPQAANRRPVTAMPRQASTVRAARRGPMPAPIQAPGPPWLRRACSRASRREQNCRACPSA